MNTKTLETHAPDKEFWLNRYFMETVVAIALMGPLALLVSGWHQKTFPASDRAREGFTRHQPCTTSDPICVLQRQHFHELMAIELAKAEITVQQLWAAEEAVKVRSHALAIESFAAQQRRLGAAEAKLVPANR